MSKKLSITSVEANTLATEYPEKRFQNSLAEANERIRQFASLGAFQVDIECHVVDRRRLMKYLNRKGFKVALDGPKHFSVSWGK